MTTDLEDRFIGECRRQGLQPTSTALIALAERLAGSRIEGDSIITPQGGSLHLADAVKGFRSEMPEAFGAVTATATAGTLTEKFTAEIAAHRRKQSMPDDWTKVRSRFADDSVTAQHMDARRRAAY